jgi:PIN domain nuclease of toxin-antitoxin system
LPIDTHVLLWSLTGDERLPRRIRGIIDDETSTIFVGAASAWEITVKHRLGKLPGTDRIAGDVERYVLSEGFQPLHITMKHAQCAGAPVGNHKDPFGRMLAAQARIEGMAIISGDRVFDGFGVRRLW